MPTCLYVEPPLSMRRLDISTETKHIYNGLNLDSAIYFPCLHACEHRVYMKAGFFMHKHIRSAKILTVSASVCGAYVCMILSMVPIRIY